MNTGLSGKIVVITGGGSGIGKGAARAFLEEGAKVAICGRSEKKLSAFREEFAGYEVFTKSVDATNVSELTSFADDVVKKFGNIDVWINNVGISDPMPFDETSEESFYRMVDSNLKTVFFGSAIAAKRMARGGAIINTSSFTSVMPTAGKALYGATKAAVDNLTQTMAVELAGRGIRVNSVIPGYIETEMTKANINKNASWLVSNIAANRLGTPEDMAGMYVFLASDQARYITGAAYKVSGGKFATQNPLWGWERK